MRFLFRYVDRKYFVLSNNIVDVLYFLNYDLIKAFRTFYTVTFKGT